MKQSLKPERTNDLYFFCSGFEMLIKGLKNEVPKEESISIAEKLKREFLTLQNEINQLKSEKVNRERIITVGENTNYSFD